MLEMETPWLLELFLFWWRFELWTEIGSSTTCPLRCFFDCSLLSPLALPFPCLLRSKHLDYEKITGPVYVGACHDVPWLFSERRIPLNVSEQCWALLAVKYLQRVAIFVAFCQWFEHAFRHEHDREKHQNKECWPFLWLHPSHSQWGKKGIIWQNIYYYHNMQ